MSRQSLPNRCAICIGSVFRTGNFEFARTAFSALRASTTHSVEKIKDRELFVRSYSMVRKHTWFVLGAVCLAAGSYAVAQTAADTAPQAADKMAMKKMMMDKDMMMM